MNIVKYSPHFINLRHTDRDAYHLLTGFLRNNSPKGIAFIILTWIQKYWNSIMIFKILQLYQKYDSNVNKQILFVQARNSFYIKNCQYKFSLKINSLSLHIYPFCGVYIYNKKIATIKDNRGYEWQATIKNIQIIFDFNQSNKCLKMQHEQISRIKIKVNADSTIESLIQITFDSINLNSKSKIELIVWEGNQANVTSSSTITQRNTIKYI